MKLLLISHYFPPEMHGGTQSYVEALARHLRDEGHEVRVVVGSPRFQAGGSVTREERRDIEIVRLHRDPATELLSGDLGSARIRDLVLAEARSFAPDLVHLHHWHALSRGLVAALRDAGLPVVVTLHDLFVSCPRHHRMPDARSFCAREVTLADCARCLAPDLAHLPLEAIEAGLGERRAIHGEDLRRADRVLAVSATQRDFIRTLPGFEDQAIEVLPIGTPELAPLPRTPSPDPGRLRLVNWAGLDPRKGPQVLLAALAMTRDPARFALTFHGRAGEPAFMAELEDLARDLDVTFAGPFADDERPAMAAAADLAVLPYLAFETYALVVDEALHLGLPVIVSDRGAPKERVLGRGLVVPADDPQALARALDDLADRPERLAAMRAAPSGARLLDEHFAALLTLYREVATRRRG